MLVQGLTQDKRREAVESIVEELKQKAGVRVLLRAPRVEVAADGPSKGPATAKVTIVEFSDFQCPYCSRGRTVIDEVVKKYGDKVRVVFRDFPLGFHDKAQKAAEAGHCAQDQGKFWQMHDWMFDNQDKLDVDALKAGARGLGLDGAKFDQCLTSGQHEAQVKRHMRDGQKVGVNGTPAFFVNGVMLSGAQPFEKFKHEIDRALLE
jgi:protein-disulfide isomerase